MSTPLRQHLGDLASSFAVEVLAAIRGVSLEELVGEAAARARTDGGRPSARAGVADRPGAASAGRDGRLARRSADDIAGVIDRIVALLRQNPKGLRAEEIRQKLGLEAKELPRPLKEALDAGRLSKSGRKRATTYTAKGSASSPKPTKSRPRAETRSRAEKNSARPRRGGASGPKARRKGAGTGARAGAAAKRARARPEKGETKATAMKKSDRKTGKRATAPAKSSTAVAAEPAASS